MMRCASQLLQELENTRAEHASLADADLMRLDAG
jgi:hypothetical protein